MPSNLIDNNEGEVSAELVRRSLLQNEELNGTLNLAWTLIEAADLVEDLVGAGYLRRCAPWLTPMRFRSCSARMPRPGPCPTCRSWTQLGKGSATRTRPDASGGARPQSPPSGRMDRVVDDLIEAATTGKAW